MDDSEQDFVDLCSKLLKRVRKKAGEPFTQKKPGQSSSQKVQEYKKQRNDKQGGDSESRFAASQPFGAGCDLDVVCGRTGCGSGNPEPPADGDLRTKDKVLLRMQHFKRVTPQKMVRTNVKIQQMNQDSWTLTSQHQIQDPLESFSSGHHTEGDEGMAVRLQQQLDREAAKAQMVDLEDGGLFFCQICHRDLSHMTHEGRTQHLNRCLDNSEESGPAPPPPSSVPDCPICGKRFKSQKSRSAHLKSCSSDMGVSPAMLLQILQRQAQENQSAASANLPAQPAANRRKGPPKPGVPARKKARKKDELLDEETMVALALSASMVKEEQQMKEKMETALPHSSVTPVLKWRPDAAKPRRKKKKDTVPRPPPLLLVQDAETAQSRLQERVSALLLRSRAPSPATPTRNPSTLPSSEGAAPFWQRSALLDGDSTCLSGFYSTELKHFFTSGESTDAAPSSPNKKPDSSVQLVRDGAPASRPRVSILPHRSQNPSGSSTPSTPGTEQLPVGSQVLQDLIDLAEDGMTLTQYGYTTKETRLSGFVQAESEELGASGFVLETTHQRSDETSDRAERTVAPPGAEERSSRQAVALSKLALDLSSMVNNPQMSDVQLQVDTGEVYFAHSFMVYARCPLLAEMVHESGIGVQEEGLPAAQRVLLNDVQGEAVLALLQYLYTSHCSISASLQPHMLELASRFDLQELEQLCRLQQDNSEAPDSTQQENVNNQTDQAFMEVLRSMWNEDDDVMDSDGGGEGGRMEEESDELTSGYREGHEEQVNEEELEEIYEFAATQRQKEVEATEEEEVGGDVVFTKQLVEEEISDEDLNPNIRPEPESGVYESRSSSASKLKTSSSKNKRESPPRASSKRSARTSLQSSASLVEDLLVSPSPVMFNLPVAGRSPGQTRYQDEESQPPCGVCTPLSPDSSLKKEEPELIVLSDSSEEVDVADFVPQSLSERSSSTQNPEDYTGIKAQTSSGADLENKEPRSVELNPDDPPDCSPELSWLIPSTPLQSSRSKRSSSTQTRSSICRTQLFPKRDSSSSSGSPSKIEPHTSSGPQKAPHPTGTTKSRVTRPLSSSSLDHKLSPSKERGVNALQLELLRLQRLTCHTLDPSKQNPLHLLNLPYSSTPVHTDVHQLPVPPAASPLTSDAEKETSSSPKRDRTPLGSPEEVELRSFHLSPLSNPSDPSSSSHRSKRRSSSSDVTRDRLKGTGQKDEEEVKADMECTKGGTGGTGVGESSLQQSLLVMDEPPIAFNDSWGLDACAEVNPGHFSLRLEDSKGLSPQETSKPSYDDGIQTTSNCGGPTVLSHQSPHPEPSSRKPKHTGFSSPPHPKTHASPEIDAGLLESKLWDSWNQEEECPPTQLRTPAPPQNKTPRPMEPITPMPHFSDMDTPELKNKLNRFGVRPLPKRQMILKLKQIHQYTHQVTSSDSEDEAPPPKRPVSTNQMAQFKEPRAPDATSPGKDKCGDGELLSASQGSNTSSTAASEESERSNPEQVLSSDGDSDSDGGISSSQAASRLQDRIQAVRSFILSTPKIFNQILQYEPLVLSQFQAELKAAGIRLGAAKLMDYLDSQCITFTTAKLGQPGTSRGGRGGKRMGKGAGGAGRKKNGAVKL